MLVSAALDFKEHLGFLGDIQDRYREPVLAVGDTHQDVYRLGLAIRNHLGTEFTVHYQPPAYGRSGYFVACAARKLAFSKVRDARLFAYAYRQGGDS